MVHGIFLSSGDFVVSGNNSPAFFLSRNGFDVWLGNARGNRYSVKHRNMQLNDPQFWNFSFHEIGLYDLPAIIDYILKITRKPKIIYFGHSQGGSAVAVLLSLIPKYNDIIAQTHYLAPALFWKYSPSKYLRETVLFPLMNVLKSQSKFDQIINNHVPRIFWHSILNAYGFFCPFLTDICKIPWLLICGKNEDENNKSDWHNVFKYHAKLVVSKTFSTKQILHFAQLSKIGKFQKFDYGDDNQNVYGNSEPPKYNIKNITSPAYIYAGEVDDIITIKDVKLMQKEFVNVKLFKILHDYNHCDFNYGSNIEVDLYNEILNEIRKISNI